MEGEAGKGNCDAWAARDPSGILSPFKFDRRAVGSDDISLKIKYCGVCYADIVWTRNLHHDSIYPVVPGHEIAGVVTEVGSNVTNLKVTRGGYSTHIVVHNRYVYKIPEGYPLELAGPLLCAGITVYTPMMRHNMNQVGKSLGVIGLGGLGHLAVKFAKAFGLKVTVFSTSESKREEALSVLGADKFVISSDKEQMKEMEGKLDFIVDCAAGNHEFDPYLNALKVHGIMVLVAFPGEIKLNPASLNLGARTLAGSLTGGTKMTQSMLEFCAENKVYPKVEMIKMDYINEALERLINRDVKYRFVIDIENSFK